VTLKTEQPVASYGNPQIEDGYTRIANELLDAIVAFDLGKRHYKIVFFVLRKTYGWNKKADVMSLSQIVAGTGLQRGHACEAVNELVSMKVLLKQEHFNGQLLELNKKYKDWKVLPKQEHVPKTGTDCSRNRNKSVPETGTTKDKKNTIKRHIPADFAISESVRTWATSNGHGLLEERLEHFKDWAISGDKKYADWDATFRNAIRGDWAHLNDKKPATKLEFINK
jgi:phage replication O-like protein O